jgi:predicted lactoylglutathione lyase
VGHNPYQHIDLRVLDLETAVAFYAALLPPLGFTVDEGGKLFRCWSAPCDDGHTWFGITEDREHRPNANRISFRAPSREDVDRLADVARKAGAGKMSGPRACPEYAETYYAAFFDDPSGNALEICFV